MFGPEVPSPKIILSPRDSLHSGSWNGNIVTFSAARHPPKPIHASVHVEFMCTGMVEQRQELQNVTSCLMSQLVGRWNTLSHATEPKLLLLQHGASLIPHPVLFLQWSEEQQSSVSIVCEQTQSTDSSCRIHNLSLSQDH